MLTYAKEMGYIERNAAHGVRKPADTRRSFRLAPEDYRTLQEVLEAAERRGEHWQAIAAIKLLALTGCRRSEIVNLKWSEVDFRGSCLRLGDTKTGASIRPLPATVRAILAGFKRDDDYVFPGVSRADKSYTSVFPKAWRRIVGGGYSPHGLRHAYASVAHELGFGELTIKALLGHARLGVTSGYIMPVDGSVACCRRKGRPSHFGNDDDRQGIKLLVSIAVEGSRACLGLPKIAKWLFRQPSGLSSPKPLG